MQEKTPVNRHAEAELTELKAAEILVTPVEAIRLHLLGEQLDLVKLPRTSQGRSFSIGIPSQEFREMTPQAEEWLMFVLDFCDDAKAQLKAVAFASVHSFTPGAFCSLYAEAPARLAIDTWWRSWVCISWASINTVISVVQPWRGDAPPPPSHSEDGSEDDDPFPQIGLMTSTVCAVTGIDPERIESGVTANYFRALEDGAISAAGGNEENSISERERLALREIQYEAQMIRERHAAEIAVAEATTEEET